MITAKLDFNEGEFGRKVMEEAQSKLREIVSSVTCPEHGERAKNFKFDSNGDIDFVACCDKLKEAIEKKLS